MVTFSASQSTPTRSQRLSQPGSARSPSLAHPNEITIRETTELEGDHNPT
jgi:hypothetical protein